MPVYQDAAYQSEDERNAPSFDVGTAAEIMSLRSAQFQTSWKIERDGLTATPPIYRSGDPKAQFIFVEPSYYRVDDSSPSFLPSLFSTSGGPNPNLQVESDGLRFAAGAARKRSDRRGSRFLAFDPSLFLICRMQRCSPSLSQLYTAHFTALLCPFPSFLRR